MLRDIIARLSEYFDEDSGDYPLILSTTQYKKFRNNFSEFLQSFVIRSRNNILFDVTLMDNLIQLLTLLADSHIRAFRHTATFAGKFLRVILIICALAMKLSSAIVDVVVELVQLKEKNATQIDTEKARLDNTGTNERLEHLLQAKTDVIMKNVNLPHIWNFQLDQKIDELSAMLQYMFKSVFVHRYRFL